MLRSVPAIALLVSLMGIAAASAQEMGGVALTPQVLDNQNASASVLDHVLARAQAFQQLRALAGGAPTSSNAANPANQASAAQATGLSSANAAGGLQGASFVAGFFQGRAANTTLVQQEINNTSQTFAVTNNTSQSFALTRNSHSLTVNAVDSPVSIGNGNIVQQQVSSSTAISNGGAPASATSVATAAPSATTHHHRGEHRDQPAQGNVPGQIAVGDATSVGGTANAVASNSSVVAR